jgi:DNA-binding transcriptional LysR family regulator
VQVLPEFEPDEVGVYAVFPPRRQISPNARAFTDWFISKQ